MLRRFSDVFDAEGRSERQARTRRELLIARAAMMARKNDLQEKIRRRDENFEMLLEGILPQTQDKEE